MRVFIDTNIFLDVLCKRPQFCDDALRLFDLAIDESIELLIADLSLANIRYITRKDFTIDQFYEVMKVFRPILTVVPMGAKVVDDALKLGAKDFEDALQYFSALQADADFLVTRNGKDYCFSDIEVLDAHSFLSRHFPEVLDEKL